jgi:Mg2+-importing ATPase
MATLLIAIMALILPFTPVGEIFGFSPVPVSLLLMVVIITVLYLMTAEMTKRFYYKKWNM